MSGERSARPAEGGPTNLTSLGEIRALLRETGSSPKKRYGQNFLINPVVAPVMARRAAEESPYILEIGPGLGTLTAELAKVARKVVAVELDTSLSPVLERTVGPLGNVSVRYGDILRVDLLSLLREEFPGERIAVCANLPYYVTSPVLARFLEEDLPVRSLTLMLQREAAERLLAPLPSREAGASTVAVAFRAEGERLLTVSRGSFYPAPKVDSAVIHLKMRPHPPVEVTDSGLMFRLVRAGYECRRKTLPNALGVAGFDKAAVSRGLRAVGLREDIRAEGLSLSDWAALSNAVGAVGAINAGG